MKEGYKQNNFPTYIAGLDPCVEPKTVQTVFESTNAVVQGADADKLWDAKYSLPEVVNLCCKAFCDGAKSRETPTIYFGEALHDWISNNIINKIDEEE